MFRLSLYPYRTVFLGKNLKKDKFWKISNVFFLQFHKGGGKLEKSQKFLSRKVLSKNLPQRGSNLIITSEKFVDFNQ